MTVVADFPTEVQRPRVEALVRQHCPEAAEELLRTPWLSDDMLVLSGSVSGVLLGFARAERIADARLPEGTFVLRALLVAPEQRRRGIARGMLAALREELSHQRGATHLAVARSAGSRDEIELELFDVKTRTCALRTLSRDDARELGFYL